MSGACYLSPKVLNPCFSNDIYLPPHTPSESTLRTLVPCLVASLCCFPLPFSMQGPGCEQGAPPPGLKYPPTPSLPRGLGGSGSERAVTRMQETLVFCKPPDHQEAANPRACFGSGSSLLHSYHDMLILPGVNCCLSGKCRGVQTLAHTQLQVI